MSWFGSWLAGQRKTHYKTERRRRQRWANGVRSKAVLFPVYVRSPSVILHLFSWGFSSLNLDLSDLVRMDDLIGPLVFAFHPSTLFTASCNNSWLLLGVRDLNLGPHSCTVSVFTHWATSQSRGYHFYNSRVNFFKFMGVEEALSQKPLNSSNTFFFGLLSSGYDTALGTSSFSFILTVNWGCGGIWMCARHFKHVIHVILTLTCLHCKQRNINDSFNQ